MSFGQNLQFLRKRGSGMTQEELAEPLVIEFSRNLVPVICDGLETDFVDETRLSLVKRKGYLIPVIRLLDNEELEGNYYQIKVYGKVVKVGTIDKIEMDSYKTIFLDAAVVCEEDYADILNKSMVKTLIDQLKEKYPRVVDELVPERISYLQVLRFLQEKIRNGENIYDLIHILEEMEEGY